MAYKPILYTDDGDEISLPTKWEICPTCRGKGTSSAYLGAFTGDDMREDPEFFEDYMNGNYDRSCDECDGTGKIEVIDTEKLDEKTLQLLIQQQLDDAKYRAEVEAERRMGA